LLPHEVKVDEIKFKRLKAYSTTFHVVDLPSGFPQLPYQKGDSLIVVPHSIEKAFTERLTFIIGDLYYFRDYCLLSLLQDDTTLIDA
jgi:hypothetical protein